MIFILWLNILSRKSYWSRSANIADKCLQFPTATYNGIYWPITAYIGLQQATVKPPELPAMAYNGLQRPTIA